MNILGQSHQTSLSKEMLPEIGWNWPEILKFPNLSCGSLNVVQIRLMVGNRVEGCWKGGRVEGGWCWKLAASSVFASFELARVLILGIVESCLWSDLKRQRKAQIQWNLTTELKILMQCTEWKQSLWSWNEAIFYFLFSLSEFLMCLKGKLQKTLELKRLKTIAFKAYFQVCLQLFHPVMLCLELFWIVMFFVKMFRFEVFIRFRMFAHWTIHLK